MTYLYSYLPCPCRLAPDYRWFISEDAQKFRIRVVSNLGYNQQSINCKTIFEYDHMDDYDTLIKQCTGDPYWFLTPINESIDCEK